MSCAQFYWQCLGSRRGEIIPKAALQDGQLFVLLAVHQVCHSSGRFGALWGDKAIGKEKSNHMVYKVASRGFLCQFHVMGSSAKRWAPIVMQFHEKYWEQGRGFVSGGFEGKDISRSCSCGGKFDKVIQVWPEGPETLRQRKRIDGWNLTLLDCRILGDASLCYGHFSFNVWGRQSWLEIRGWYK